MRFAAVKLAAGGMFGLFRNTLTGSYRDLTAFQCEGGVAVLRDALATGVDEQVESLGSGAPALLLRELRCTRGEVSVDIDYRPREQVDTASGELLGNFPQACSHIGLVNAAQAIGEARQRAKPDPKDAVRVRRARRHGR